MDAEGSRHLPVTLDQSHELGALVAAERRGEICELVNDDNDLRRYLSSADICVDPDPSNPYNDRSTMVKISEFMALSKPIVAFDLVENRFTAQLAALFVQGNDELAFARGLVELMDDPERRAEMGAFGRRRVEESLAWLHYAPKLVDVYEKLLPSRGKTVVSHS